MTTKAEILKAIRRACLDCCGDSQKEVSNCIIGEKCPLYPYRMGTDPNPARGGSNLLMTRGVREIPTTERVKLGRNGE